MGGRSPGYQLPPDHLQRVKQMLTPDWAQNETNNAHNGYCLAVLVQFVHQGCASACMGNFHFGDYKPCPFQNTVEKTETKTWQHM